MKSKRIVKHLSYGFFVMIAVAIILFSPVDRTHVFETEYFKSAHQAINSLALTPFNTNFYGLNVGWAKINITPSYPLPLSGYGSRKGELATGVHDSLYVRGFVFDNGTQKAALITLDALLVPPSVTYRLQKRLPEIGFNLNQVFLSATHTHTSVGGWADSWIGNLFAGDYNDQIVKDLTDKILLTIQLAAQNTEKALIGFKAVNAEEFVSNRLIGKNGSVDPYLRFVRIQKYSGESAIITTFSAHATCLAGEDMDYSRDYPGALVDSLEKFPEIDFAAFCAGGVGSHRPESGGRDKYNRIAWMAKGLSEKIQDEYHGVSMRKETNILSLNFEIPLREPHWRISLNWRFRPWVFNILNEPTPHYISFLNIGDIVFAGTPCDFSGELIPEIQSGLNRKNKPLIVTSFNGGYIGYITKDAWYDLEEYETMTMNWFGPNNGQYFIYLIRRITNLLS